jgi:hypothetical protein
MCWFYYKVLMLYLHASSMAGGLRPLSIAHPKVAVNMALRVFENTIRKLSEYQCAHNLFEEFVCAKVVHVICFRVQVCS